MRAQKLQQAMSRDIPSIASGSGAAAAAGDVEWKMVRKLEEEQQQQYLAPSVDISTLPADISTLSSAPPSAAVAHDSDVGGWKMIRKNVAASPPPTPPPPPQQQHQQGMVELPDAPLALNLSSDFEGGFFVQRRGAGVDTSMDVEDFDDDE